MHLIALFFSWQCHLRLELLPAYNFSDVIMSTDFSVVISYGGIDVGQYWPRYWLTAFQSSPEPMLTYHKQGLVTFAWGQIPKS